MFQYKGINKKSPIYWIYNFSKQTILEEKAKFVRKKVDSIYQKKKKENNNKNK